MRKGHGALLAPGMEDNDTDNDNGNVSERSRRREASDDLVASGTEWGVLEHVRGARQIL